MGPLRRGLSLALIFPTAGWADVCDKVRPNWEGTPVTAVQEALFLAATPISLALVLASLIVLRLRHQWGALAVVVGWTIAITLLTMADPTGMRPQAATEGCIGSPTLFIIAVAAICGAIILYTAPKSSGAETSD